MGRERRADDAALRFGGRTVQEFDGAKLFTLRRERLLMQEELGHLASVSRGEIGHLERGVRKPTVRTWRNLAAALGVDADLLLSKDGDERDSAPAALA
jgi:transcriptional regulator with XRE-family HTH domain